MPEGVASDLWESCTPVAIALQSYPDTNTRCALSTPGRALLQRAIAHGFTDGIRFAGGNYDLAGYPRGLRSTQFINLREVYSYVRKRTDSAV